MLVSPLTSCRSGGDSVVQIERCGSRRTGSSGAWLNRLEPRDYATGTGNRQPVAGAVRIEGQCRGTIATAARPDGIISGTDSVFRRKTGPFWAIGQHSYGALLPFLRKWC
jgi:hypothetical protein